MLTNTLNIFSSYQLDKTNLLRNLNLDDKLNEFSIYGAGEHTKLLIEGI